MGCRVAASQQRIEHDDRFVQVPDKHPVQRRTQLLVGGRPRSRNGGLSGCTELLLQVRVQMQRRLQLLLLLLLLLQIDGGQAASARRYCGRSATAAASYYAGVVFGRRSSGLYGGRHRSGVRMIRRRGCSQLLQRVRRRTVCVRNAGRKCCEKNRLFIKKNLKSKWQSPPFFPLLLNRLKMIVYRRIEILEPTVHCNFMIYDHDDLYGSYMWPLICRYNQPRLFFCTYIPCKCLWLYNLKTLNNANHFHILIHYLYVMYAWSIVIWS